VCFASGCHLSNGKRTFSSFSQFFQKSIPYVHVWMANSDALLIGSVEELPPIDYREFQKRMAMPKIKQKLAKVDVNSPGGFSELFLS